MRREGLPLPFREHLVAPQRLPLAGRMLWVNEQGLFGRWEWQDLQGGAPERRLVGRLPRCSCLLYTSPSPRDRTRSRMPSSA